MVIKKGLSASKILEVSDVAVEKIDVPEWGGEVYIRVMTLKDRLLFEKRHTGPDGRLRIDDKSLVIDLISLCLCHSDGEKLFDKLEEANTCLENKNGKIVRMIFDKCSNLNYLSKDSSEVLEQNL